MTRFSTFVAILCVAGFAQNSQAETVETKNPPKPLADHAKDLKPKLKAIKDALQQAVANNKFEEGLAKYNQDMATLRAAFILNRTSEYNDSRLRMQYDLLVAETKPGGKEERTNAEYKAPSGMTRETFEYRTESEIGNTYKWCNATLDGGTRVVVTLLAKPLSNPTAGASRVKVHPRITWKHVDPSAKAVADWDVVIELVQKL